MSEKRLATLFEKRHYPLGKLIGTYATADAATSKAREFTMSKKRPYISDIAHTANISCQLSELKSRLLPPKLTILPELSL